MHSCDYSIVWSLLVGCSLKTMDTGSGYLSEVAASIPGLLSGRLRPGEGRGAD